MSYPSTTTVCAPVPPLVSFALSEFTIRATLDVGVNQVPEEVKGTNKVPTLVLTPVTWKD